MRHMCAVGLLSKPKPSFGCLKLRPTMSGPSKTHRSALLGCSGAGLDQAAQIDVLVC